MIINHAALRTALLKAGIKLVVAEVKTTIVSQSYQSAKATRTPVRELPPARTPVLTVPALSLDMPTTAETTVELKRRLGKELYRMELDLQNGGRIAGKPCDCLGSKHHLGIEATAEELMSYEKNPVYGKVVSWLDKHSKEFEPSEIAKKPPEYYQGLTPEIRQFRKEVMGTEALTSLLSSR